MSEQIAEREIASRRMLGDIEQGLALIDQRFTELVQQRRRARQSFPRTRSAARAASSTSSRRAPASRMWRSALWPSVPNRCNRASSGCSNRFVASSVRPWARPSNGDRAAGRLGRHAAPGYRLDPRRRGRGRGSARREQRRDCGAGGSVRRLPRQRRRRRWERPVAPHRARLADRPGRARGPGPEQRNRPRAGHRIGPGQGNRRPCRRACARGNRGGDPGQRGQAIGRGRQGARKGHPRVGRGAAARGRSGRRQGSRIRRAPRPSG